ncbi:alpha-E domain-containing protein [Oleiagrimonas soli]|uniref:Putative alpha-E superfamily protein n=1 Tax=Oleiagrimonas soli TaxID=1543381 RepID=A0A841KMT1_9GAMM|nr:alpha-E domain-containing protein [Oleiagrimonas soli]MBB6183358.1 putative alpha-E superfamily protein [Oleiagrimonas soli]
MLCRTASDLYWLSRYVERAENTARLIDLTQRISLLPERLDPGKSSTTAWRRGLDALGQLEPYEQTCGEIQVERVLRWLMLDADNPSSIRNCLFQGRELGRAQRGAITAEMYQELNTSWLDLEEASEGAASSDGVSPFLEWVKTRSAAFRGVTIGTMGRDEGYHFMVLGTSVERADNTVRLLDIKYAQGEEPESGSRDFIQYYQWSAMLQAMSAFETYRKTYRDAVHPLHVSEMMIFQQDMPHSLAVCTQTLHRILELLAEEPRSEVVRQAGALAARLRYGCMAEVQEQGIKVFLDDFMQRLEALTWTIVETFMTSTDIGAGLGSEAGRNVGAMVS